MKLTIGSDPEYMLSRGAEFISAIPVFGIHGKEKPKQLGGGITGYWDNVNAEFTLPPATTAEELVSNFSTLFTKGNDFVSPHNVALTVKAAHSFDRKALSCPESRVFGCRGEGCVYKNEVGDYLYFEPPSPEIIGKLRVCGGHIHIGRDDFKSANYTEFLMDYESKYLATRAMDLCVGLPLTALDKDPTSGIRKTAYGRPGSMRETPYGIEYRTLSNFWTHHPKLIELVFHLTTFAMEYAAQQEPEFNHNELMDAINSSDSTNCWNLFMKSPVPNKLKKLAAEAHSIPFTGFPTY